MQQGHTVLQRHSSRCGHASPQSSGIAAMVCVLSHASTLWMFFAFVPVGKASCPTLRPRCWRTFRHHSFGQTQLSYAGLRLGRLGRGVPRAAARRRLAADGGGNGGGSAELLGWGRRRGAFALSTRCSAAAACSSPVSPVPDSLRNILRLLRPTKGTARPQLPNDCVPYCDTQ
jgi:hypothetical protein